MLTLYLISALAMSPALPPGMQGPSHGGPPSRPYLGKTDYVSPPNFVVLENLERPLYTSPPSRPSLVAPKPETIYKRDLSKCELMIWGYVCPNPAPPGMQGPSYGGPPNRPHIGGPPAMVRCGGIGGIGGEAIIFQCRCVHWPMSSTRTPW
jgi:hypothetical protein